MLPLVAVIALVSFISVNVFISRQKQRRNRRAPEAPKMDPSTMAMVERVWMEVAEERGLSVDPAGALGIRGDVDGVPCEVELGEVEQGVSTVARAHRIPEVAQRLSITPRDWTAKARALLGAKGVSTGSAEIDAAFVVTASPEDVARRALDDATRELLLAIASRRPHLDYDGSTVELRLDGAEMVHENLGAVLDLLVRVAKLPT
jgi:hypothetical protein